MRVLSITAVEIKMIARFSFLPVFLTAIGGARAQQAIPAPAPIPNPHFPSQLLDGFMFSIRSAGISENMSIGVSWNRGASRILMAWNEKNPMSDTWYTTEVLESVSYTVTGVSTREGGRVVIVGGLEYDGSKILEKWSYEARDGGYAIVSSSSLPPAPIGTPMGEFQAVEILNGESFVVPPSPTMTGSPATRETLWTGTSTGVLSSLVADPEGRYVIALSYPDGNLLRFDLSVSQPTPQVIATAATYPFLAGATDLALWKHATQGRKIAVAVRENCLVSNERLLLGDANNDGVFETGSFFTPSQWTAAGYDVYGTWSYYWNTGVTFDWDD